MLSALGKCPSGCEGVHPTLHEAYAEGRASEALARLLLIKLSSALLYVPFRGFQMHHGNPRRVWGSGDGGQW